MTNPRILIVEDEFLIRLTLAEALADEGFDCAEAESGDAALDLIKSGPMFDLLLTDVQLPGKLDGFALVHAARAISPDLRVIFMTGRPDRARDTGASRSDLYIAKPYLPSEICHAARRLISGAA
jgi:DNA-binding response OmpR family regulator